MNKRSDMQPSLSTKGQQRNHGKHRTASCTNHTALRALWCWFGIRFGLDAGHRTPKPDPTPGHEQKESKHVTRGLIRTNAEALRD